MDRPTYRVTVKEVRTGDIVVHYRSPYVVAFSRAREHAKHYDELPLVSGENYGSGWRLRTEYFDLKSPVHRKQFASDLVRLIQKHYPVNRDGHIRQGYFFPFDIDGVQSVLKRVAEPLPQWLTALVGANKRRTPRTGDVTILMSEHADRERRTARLVRACYTQYVAPGKITAGQLYALCKLTWITKGGANLDEGLPDNTRTVVAPALMALTGANITATAMHELPHQIKEAKAPAEIVRLVAKPLGFVNFYAAFRNVARDWIAAHLRDVTKMVKIVASASSDLEVREAYGMLDQLPLLPRKSGGHMPAVALITPMLACLDPRSRSPIINSRFTVQERLKLLGLRHATVCEQFDGFVTLIGQAGIRDAFDLDTSNMSVVVHALKAKPRSRVQPRRASSSGATKNLDERDDADVEFFRRSRSVTMRRLHHTMTNALQRFCNEHGLMVEEGSSQECMFDALIREHDSDRHLLVEVKTDSAQPTCRLAVGQLLDYRRQLKDRARTDLAVLFPKKPSATAKVFLEDVGVKLLWFTGGMKTVKGLGAP